jgi:hypothetical protein
MRQRRLWHEEREVVVTLYDYLGSLVVDGSNLIWSFSPLAQSQLDAAAGKPYVRVEEMEETIEEDLYRNQIVIGQYVDVYIFQASSVVNVAPVRHTAMKLYFDLFNAPKFVNKHIYGQPLIACNVDVGLPPNYDKDSSGLAGMVRFRLLFPRG